MTNGAPGQPTVRVAVREIKENTWRALVAAGVSAGEASVAAEAVTIAEVCFGTGLDAVIDEISQTDRATKRPVEVRNASHRNSPMELHDPAGRGLLQVVPLAIGLVVAGRKDAKPVLVPQARWHPVLAGLLVAETDQPYGDTIDLLIGYQSAPDEPDRSAAMARVGKGTLTMVGGRAEATEHSGLLVASGSAVGATDRQPIPPPGAQIWSYEELAQLRAEAEREGLKIPGERWNPVNVAAKKYLVPD